METTNKLITIKTQVNADIGKVWDLFTKPEHIRKWYHASDDWHAPYAENDLRVGGKFKTTMEARNESEGFDFEGEYTRIQKNKLIEFNITDGRKVSIEFTDNGKKTKIVEVFEPESVNSEELQKSGWQAILDNFKKYAETSL